MLQAQAARANRDLQKGKIAMILPITLTITGAAAIILVWLGLRVSMLRRPLKISIGDGGNPALARRIRAHANFAENMPIVLILLATIELATGGSLWLWGAAILFVIARIAHVFGMDRDGKSLLRMLGMSLSWIVIIALGVAAIVIAYQSPSLQSRTRTAPPMRAEAPTPQQL
jgi:uncharacterized membrane protein YecN with MAPEG domain